jgi:hypothetical protein
VNEAAMTDREDRAAKWTATGERVVAKHWIND